MKRKKNYFLQFLIILASIVGLIVLVYFVMGLSFQNGEASTNMTVSLAKDIADRIFSEPSSGDVNTISLCLRYFAHLFLFFVVGVVMTFVSMVIFRRYFRIIGVLLSAFFCYALSYFTEYFKQYIDGRHYNMTDVKLNWYGCVFGICFMIVTYFMNKILVRISE